MSIWGPARRRSGLSRMRFTSVRWGVIVRLFPSGNKRFLRISLWTDIRQDHFCSGSASPQPSVTGVIGAEARLSADGRLCRRPNSSLKKSENQCPFLGRTVSRSAGPAQPSSASSKNSGPAKLLILRARGCCLQCRASHFGNFTKLYKKSCNAFAPDCVYLCGPGCSRPAGVGSGPITGVSRLSEASRSPLHLKYIRVSPSLSLWQLRSPHLRPDGSAGPHLRPAAHRQDWP